MATGGEPGGRAREKIGSGYEFKQFEMRNAFIHDRPHRTPGEPCLPGEIHDSQGQYPYHRGTVNPAHLCLAVAGGFEPRTQKVIPPHQRRIKR